MKPYKRMTVPRGWTAATLVFLVLAWAPFAVSPASGLAAPLVQTVVVAALTVLTASSRRWKVLVVRTLQRLVINPVVRVLLAIGLNPLGLVLLETRGRVSGRPRRTPVGDGRLGESLWIIAEHGDRAHYVRNIARDPRVRVRLRRGLRLVWVEGIAELRPREDALTRQRQVVRWHPLRALNAVTVRLLGTDLLVVHVALGARPAPTVTAGSEVRAAP